VPGRNRAHKVRGDQHRYSKDQIIQVQLPAWTMSKLRILHSGS
jgi:hypothetical protein